MTEVTPLARAVLERTEIVRQVLRQLRQNCVSVSAVVVIYEDGGCTFISQQECEEHIVTQAEKFEVWPKQ